MRLMKHYKPSDSNIPETLENETGLMGSITIPEDTFAFASQIIGIKNQVDDALYRMDRNLGQFKGKVEDSVTSFAARM